MSVAGKGAGAQASPAHIRIRLLEAGDEAILDAAPADLFDHQSRWDLVAEFLADPRHHIAVALDGGRAVGFASAVHYVHPDKPAELWINEVSVIESHRRAGIADRLMRALFDAGREAGCTQAWVLTERSNVPACRLYAGLGGVEPVDGVVMFEFRLDANGS